VNGRTASWYTCARDMTKPFLTTTHSWAYPPFNTYVKQFTPEVYANALKLNENTDDDVTQLVFEVQRYERAHGPRSAMFTGLTFVQNYIFVYWRALALFSGVEKHILVAAFMTHGYVYRPPDMVDEDDPLKTWKCIVHEDTEAKSSDDLTNSLARLNFT